MATELKIGLIGLDTSHVVAFTRLLNDPTNEFHIPGGKVVAAFPGGSADLPFSAGRVEDFTTKVRDEYGVEILDSPEAVEQQCNALLLTAVDGRVHPQLLKMLAPAGKPIFIDKPFALSTPEAREMVEVAQQHNVSLMSCSSLRFAEPLVEVLRNTEVVTGADCSGPMELVPAMPGLFWYGIHTVEMLYAALGQGCREVRAETNDGYDLITAVWADGRIGTVRGNRTGNNKFYATIHGEKISAFADASNHPRPFYAALMQRVMDLFRGEAPAVAIDETLEIVRFIEAANQSRETGQKVAL
jgi:predicted dehydrogenase